MVFLHGVGLDPRLFGPVMDEITTHHAIGDVRAPLREPYGGEPVGEPTNRYGSLVSTAEQAKRRRDWRDGCTYPLESYAGFPAEPVEEQARSIIDELERSGSTDVTIVGVSGGATIALAIAIGGSPRLAGVVAHEPLLGPLAGDLHDAARTAASRFAAAPGIDGVTEFLRYLVGAETWAELPATAHEFAVTHADVVRAEVPRFLEFAPTFEELEGIDTPLLVTTGARSHARRHAAAAVLEGTGASSAVIPNAGHLAHWERPTAFAAVVADRLACRSER